MARKKRKYHTHYTLRGGAGRAEYKVESLGNVYVKGHRKEAGKTVHIISIGDAVGSRKFHLDI